MHLSGVFVYRRDQVLGSGSRGDAPAGKDWRNIIAVFFHLCFTDRLVREKPACLAGTFLVWRSSCRAAVTDIWPTVNSAVFPVVVQPTEPDWGRSLKSMTLVEWDAICKRVSVILNLFTKFPFSLMLKCRLSSGWNQKIYAQSDVCILYFTFWI